MIKDKFKLTPVMSFILLTGITIIISGILSIFKVQAEYDVINSATNELVKNVVKVNGLFSLSGLKYIVTTAVKGFVSFTPLSMLIIVLIGIGVLEYTGFLKTAFTLLTRNVSKNTLTFLIVFISIVFSIVGDIGFVVMLPLSALLFKYGHRNPLGGIIVSFVSLSFGYGINVFLSITDSNLLSLTLKAARLLEPTYKINNFFLLYVMIFALIVTSIVFTRLTEKYLMPNLEKYEFDEDEVRITNKELRGLVVSITAAIIYILIIIYMIIPGLPLSGGLLDKSGVQYIDKIFGPSSLFSQGIVFIFTLLMFIIGLIYGIMTKTIKNSTDLTKALGYSLDGIGDILVLLFFASLFVGVFKETNIGYVITASFASFFSNLELTGVWLILVLLLVTMISNLFYTTPVLKWSILSSTVVPLFMNASLSPEFAFLVFVAGDSITKGVTPLMAYFVIYIAFLQKYNKGETITISKGIKYTMPYFLAIFAIWFIIIFGWYITGLPIGIGSTAGITYVN